MAWVVSRVRADGREHRYLYWRERAGRGTKARWRQRTRALGPVPLEVAEAEAAVVERDVERRTPRPVATGAVQAVNAFLQEWETVKRRRPETIRYYRSLLEPLARELGAKVPLRSWAAKHLVEYLAARPSWSPRHVQMLIVACRTFTKWARRRGWDVQPFALDVEGPRVTAPPREAYTVEQARLLLEESTGTPLAAPVGLALLAGLSLGDLQAITWAAVDLRAKRIQTVRSKTGRPIAVPIGKRLLAILKAAGPGAADAPVCPDPIRENPSRDFRALCRRAGVPAKGGWKRCRHTYSTLLGAAQVDRATHQALMAHAPGSQLTDRYSHSDWARLEAGTRAIEGALG